jgi:hypothetical protein
MIACRATVNDPVDILFSAYMVVRCHNFRSYIKRKQDAYTDGILTLTHKELIMLATNKFNLLKQDGTRELSHLMKRRLWQCRQNLPLSRAYSSWLPTSRRPQEPRMTTRNNNKKKNKKNNANKKEHKKDENWKRTPPKEGEAHEKKVKGSTWCWCKHHMVWGNHKESDC